MSPDKKAGVSRVGGTAAGLGHRIAALIHRDFGLRHDCRQLFVMTPWLNAAGSDGIHFTMDGAQQDTASHLTHAINKGVTRYGLSICIEWMDKVPRSGDRSAYIADTACINGCYCITVMKRLTAWEKLRRRLSNFVWRHTGRKARRVVCVE